MQVILFIVGILACYSFIYYMFLLLKSDDLAFRVGYLWAEFSYRAIAAGLFFVLLLIFWRGVVPFNIFGYWFWRGSLLDILGSVCPIFVWGVLAFFIMLKIFG